MLIARRSVGYREWPIWGCEQPQRLEGSIVAWTHIEGSLVSGDVPTRRVHVYGPRWDLAASGYESVW